MARVVFPEMAELRALNGGRQSAQELLGPIDARHLLDPGPGEGRSAQLRLLRHDGSRTSGGLDGPSEESEGGDENDDGLDEEEVSQLPRRDHHERDLDEPEEEVAGVEGGPSVFVARPFGKKQDQNNSPDHGLSGDTGRGGPVQEHKCG